MPTFLLQLKHPTQSSSPDPLPHSAALRRMEVVDCLDVAKDELVLPLESIWKVSPLHLLHETLYTGGGHLIETC